MKLFKLPSLREIIASALISLMLIAGITPAAVAQSFGPAYTIPAQVQTYRAAILGLTPAASATDFFTIAGISTGQVRVRQIHCDNISTANASIVLQVVKRSTLNATGTASTLTDVRLNSDNPAGTAVVKAYTVNPGTLGTAIGTVAEGVLTSTTAASSAGTTGLTFDFTNQFLVINSATTQVSLNANATSFTSGSSLSCWIEWQEA